MLTNGSKSVCDLQFNCILETGELINVTAALTGSHIHWQVVVISRKRYNVLPKRYYRPLIGSGIAYGLSNGSNPMIFIGVDPVSTAKTAEPIKMPFGQTRCVSPRNHVLTGGTYGRHLANAIKGSVLGGCGCCYHYCRNWLLWSWLLWLGLYKTIKTK